MINTVSEMTKLWDVALIKIEERLGEKQIFDSFFAGSYITDVHGDTIDVVVNSVLAVTLLGTKYYDIISDVIGELTESNYRLNFMLESDVSSPKPIVQAPKKAPYFKDASINKKLTFDNFVVGNFNREASQAALLVASNPGKMYNPLFLYSKSGLGKTHLMQSIGNYILQNGKQGTKILYVTATDFVEEYIRFAKGEREAETLKDYICGFDVLLIDDIQMLANKTGTQEMFFTIYERMHGDGKQIVLTSDRQPVELKDFADRLVTRFNMGLKVEIGEPDQNTCVEILKKKIVANGMEIERFDDSVLYFIADKFSNDIRELEGALGKLIFYAVQIKQSSHITMDVAAEAVASLMGSKTLSSQLNEQKVINVVADYYNLTPSQLTGKIRTGQIALARHIAMYLIRNTLDIPLKKIGDMFGGKDHTTIMSAVTKVDKMLKTDKELQTAIEELQKRLKA